MESQLDGGEITKSSSLVVCGNEEFNSWAAFNTLQLETHSLMELNEFMTFQETGKQIPKCPKAVSLPLIIGYRFCAGV